MALKQILHGGRFCACSLTVDVRRLRLHDVASFFYIDQRTDRGTTCGTEGCAPMRLLEPVRVSFQWRAQTDQKVVLLSAKLFNYLQIIWWNYVSIFQFPLSIYIKLLSFLPSFRPSSKICLFVCLFVCSYVRPPFQSLLVRMYVPHSKFVLSYPHSKFVLS